MLKIEFSIRYWVGPGPQKKPFQEFISVVNWSLKLLFKAIMSDILVQIRAVN